MLFQHLLIKSLKIFPTASMEIVMQSLDGQMMVDCTPKGVLSRQTLSFQPSITKTPILKRKDDPQKLESRLTKRVTCSWRTKHLDQPNHDLSFMLSIKASNGYLRRVHHPLDIIRDKWGDTWSNAGPSRENIFGVKLFYWHMIYVFNRLGNKLHRQMMDVFLDCGTILYHTVLYHTKLYHYIQYHTIVYHK